MVEPSTTSLLPFSRLLRHAGNTLGLFYASMPLLFPRLQRKIQGLPIPGITLSARLFVISHDAKLLFVGGHWDNSVRAITLGRSRNITHLVRHFGKLTLQFEACNMTLFQMFFNPPFISYRLIL